jgi:molybdopterin synthase sulfur carrier subunit
MIRVMLPTHLRTLANVGKEIELEIAPPVTQRAIIDAIETQYPMLRGTIRDGKTQQRRSLVRFFACKQDLSHESPDAPLPEAVTSGAEPYMVIGAMAGG